MIDLYITSAQLTGRPGFCPRPANEAERAARLAEVRRAAVLLWHSADASVGTTKMKSLVFSALLGDLDKLEAKAYAFVLAVEQEPEWYPWLDRAADGQE